MRYGIPLLADRVAPRCTFADSVLLVTTKRRRIREQSVVPLEGHTWADLAAVLAEQGVETLICGGINLTTRDSIQALDVAVIDNVAGTCQEVLEALRRERIHPGFGLDPEVGGRIWIPGEEEPWVSEDRVSEERVVEDGYREAAGELAPQDAARSASGREGMAAFMDCLACQDRVCLRGDPCPFLDSLSPVPPTEETRRILDAAWDVSLEKERTLCRLAELVYFALEMGYKKLGVAYCVDLREPAAILTGVLRRFFHVVPVCCRVRGMVAPGGGASGPDPSTEDRRGQGTWVGEETCDPSGVSAVLNAAGTDLNVLVGLCVGTDCIVNRESVAPVTTLFVKDKSLANNPIGAVYSHYYLKDI
jgi:uncharacterized metal-binding protein/predicted Fe-Mo cluster-binding NifX family protein